MARRIVDFRGEGAARPAGRRAITNPSLAERVPEGGGRRRDALYRPGPIGGRSGEGDDVLPEARSIDELRRRFRWEIPDRFNIAHACCTRHADAANRPALVVEEADGRVGTFGFLDLERLSNRLANLWRAGGVGAGNRVGILAGQRVETLLGHLAAYKLGAVAVPLFGLFGPEALAYRLGDSGAKVLLADAGGAEKVAALRPALPDLRQIWCADGPTDGAEPLWPALERAGDAFTAEDTGPDDPAVIIYTSGTTGQPKGALHGHRVLLGHLPGVQMPQDFAPKAGDRFWTPADWAWIGGLFDVLMPSLHLGVPVVAWRAAKFDPDAAVAFMARHGVRNVFMPPTALRLMRRAGIDALGAGVRLRSMASGGERLGDETVDWVRDRFGVEVNEFYGQTECNVVVSGCASILPRRAGAIGVAVPGHEVAVVDEAGAPQPPGSQGVIAVRSPDPVMFLRYWNNEPATRAKFRGSWLLTGDTGRIDPDGYVTYLGREDDLINSAGYRIGPAEVEACLLGHPAVALCAVVGVPDEVRGERVKAFVVPREGVAPGEDLAAEIGAFVKARLAAHEYPREVEFADALPLTATGKVRRADLRARPAAGVPGKGEWRVP